MRILYISPSPPPKIKGTDGLFTEIGYLQEYFGGDMISLSPARSLHPLFPVSLYGMNQLLALRRYDRNVDLVHLFFPYLKNFHVLRHISRPIVFTITTGVDLKCLPQSMLQSMPPCTLVVSSSQEADILLARGFHDVHVVRPGIDLSWIPVMPPLEPGSEFVLLAGSAPWIRSQFETKGFDLLLKAMTRIPDLRLICLWRGRLYSEMSNRIGALGLEDRVEIIQEKTDISGILSRCHAAVVLTATSDLVKSYPNSLMEALAAGRPVLISRSNPMSYYVDDNDCGKVVDNLCYEELIDAISDIRKRYSSFAKAASLAGGNLSSANMIEGYRHIYQKIME